MVQSLAYHYGNCWPMCAKLQCIKTLFSLMLTLNVETVLLLKALRRLPTYSIDVRSQLI